MRVFITGASGYIGSATVKEAIKRGHTVTGLARNDESAAKLRALGATPHTGDLNDIPSLVEAAKQSDAVLHLAFIHDFTKYSESGQIDLKAVEAMTAELKGKVFIGTSGTLITARDDRPANELDAADLNGMNAIRGNSEVAVVEAAKRGVKSAVIRLSPTVHSVDDTGFTPALVTIARKTGVSGYPSTSNGENYWPAVHRDDAAKLYVLAMEKLADGSLEAGHYLHAAAELITTKQIAAAIAERLNLGEPKPQELSHFGMLAHFFGRDNQISSELTRQWTGWNPTGPSLVEDIKNPEFANSPSPYASM